jgi:hypothetical protein
MSKSSNDEYFAAASSDTIAAILMEKAESWVKDMESSVQYQRMSKSYHMYYGLSQSGSAKSSSIMQAGPRGEYALMMNNHYRNNILHVLNLTTSERPSLECRAANTDPKSIEQNNLGNQLLDWYMREKKVERFARDATEYALFLSEGFVSCEWEPTLGAMKAVDPSTQMPIYEGDIAYSKFTPMDVIRDLNRTDTEMPWCMVIRWKNKFNLAAKYQDDRIKTLQTPWMLRYREMFMNASFNSSSDLIPEFTFFHERCEALPQGRVVKVLDADILCIDSPLPTTKIPVFRVSSSDQAETPFGYCSAFDAMAQQDGLNLLDSITMTNQKTFGVGTIVGPEGGNVKHEQLAEGLNYIQVNETNGQLRAVNFTSTPAEIFNFREKLKGDMEVIFGLNSVVKGHPDANIKAGNFAALIASQALQFNSGIEASFAHLIEDLGGMTIEILQKFATTERVAGIVGENKEYMLKSFSSKDINEIRTVTADVSTYLSKTSAGRLQMAQDLMAMGQVKRADQYITVLESGKFDPVIENEETALNNIRRENQMMRRGQKPVMIMTDDHAKHILEHSSVLDDPDARVTPQIVQAVTAHVLEHYQQWQTMDPGLQMALGRQPLGLPMGMPPAANPSAGPAKVGSPNMNEDPNLPEPAKNPLTGQVPVPGGA